MEKRSYIGLKTDIGKNRAKNEDVLLNLTTRNGQLLLVADGNGAFPNGDVAATLSTQAIADYVQKHAFEHRYLSELEQAVLHANNSILSAAYQNPSQRGMAASIAIVLLKEQVVYIANIGECHVFLFRNEKLLRLSEEHTYGAKLLKDGSLPEAEAEQHPRKNEVTQRLGNKSVAPFVRQQAVELQEGDCLLMMSSGLERMVEKSAVANILREEDLSPQAKADKLINLGNFRGGLENLSAVVVEHKTQPTNSATLPTHTPQTSEDLGKTKVYTLAAFLLFAIFMLSLFFQAKSDIKREGVEGFTKADSLALQVEWYKRKVGQMEEKERKRWESLSNIYFDSFDSDHYRPYGLFRDEGMRFTRADVSTKFNVFNTAAIKSSDVMGERWFIVPIKGIHYLEEGEELGDVAQKYYSDLADSLLIKEFNYMVKPGRHLFIPFNK